MPPGRRVHAIEKCLLAVDGSESSGWAAAHVVGRIHAGDPLEVHVLNVQPVRPTHPALRKVVSPAEIKEYARSQANDAMRDATAVLTRGGIAFSTHVAFGHAAFEIAQHVETLGIGHVVMGTRAHSAIVRFAIGSVATRVTNLIEIPVTLVPRPQTALRAAPASGSATPESAATRITMVPVDGSEYSDRSVELAIRESAAGAPRMIVLLNVQIPYPTGKGWDDIPRAVLEQAYRDWGIDSLRSARGRLDVAGCAYRAEMMVGSPAESIAQRARELDCDRIVMGTRGLGEGGSFFLGSVAVKVVHLAGVPVTLVR